MTSSREFDAEALLRAERALARLARHRPLAKSPKLLKLLRFIVRETLAGRSAQVKGFTIAQALYGREASFDPQMQSHIRVEVRSLRHILETYYRQAPPEEDVRIRLPRTGCRPVILFEEKAEAQAPVQRAPFRLSGPLFPRRTGIAAAAAGVIVAFGLIGLAGSLYGFSSLRIAEAFGFVKVAVAEPVRGSAIQN